MNAPTDRPTSPLDFNVTMALRNYSSTVDPTMTAGEIQQLLASHGARRVALDYDEDGQCEVITFMADVGGQLAKIEAQSARLEQLFLGYGVTNNGETVYERLQVNKTLLTD